jgi:hypothetical protein
MAKRPIHPLQGYLCQDKTEDIILGGQLGMLRQSLRINLCFCDPVERN